MDRDFLKNVELFNVANVKKTAIGYALERYPEGVISKMNEWGSMIGKHSSGCEIRFVPTGDNVRITLMSECDHSSVTVLRGDRTEQFYQVPKSTFITISIGKSPLFDIKNPDFFKDDIYDKNVVRIVLGEGRFIVSEIETFGREIRPPKKAELPQKTILAYGSSVTHGACSVLNDVTYPAICARFLGAQALNKGLGGSCFMENEVADWFAEGIDYDLMIYEAGTNMAGVFDESEIEKRGTYMLEKLFDKNPDKYIFLITPMIPLMKLDRPEEYKKCQQAVLNMHKNINTDKCVLVPFEKIELDTTYVTADRIHPSTEAHVMMGYNLANIIRPYTDKKV